MLLRSRSPIRIVTGIGLGNEDRAVRRDGQTIEQRSQRIDSFHQLIGFGIEDEQIPVGYFGMLDDVDHMTERQHIVVNDRMFPRIERHQFTVDVVLVATGQLRLVVGLKRNDKQLALTHCNGSRILSRNRQPLGDLSRGHVHNGNLILR